MGAYANDPKPLKIYTGYTGGMMVHLGYAYGGVLSPVGHGDIKVQGLSTGIGGRIVFGLGQNFRIGSEGYVSTINYGEKRKASIGWGGVTMDYGWQRGRWRPYIGTSIGFGTYENMTAVNTPLNDNTPQEIVWHEYSVVLVNPFVACEYNITQRIKACARLEWMTSPVAQSGIVGFGDFSTGPRLLIGFMFGH